MCRLLIINPNPFGYNPATYYYCQYLKKKYAITYISWDFGWEKIKMDGVRTVYVSRRGGPWRIIRFVRKVRQCCDKDAVFLVHHIKLITTILRFFFRGNIMILDIRTGSVSTSRFKRFYQDWLLKFESRLFDNITVISESLAQRLHIENKAEILPLGADVISDKNKKFDKLSLLYVGTLYNRNIERPIIGFMNYCRAGNSYSNTATFTVIGTGPGDEENHLRNLVKKEGFEYQIYIIGRVPHNKLKNYFDNHNIGVSYIPMTEYYDVQPPTKTFEYLLSGLAVIGTATSENQRVINDINGVLTGDSPEEFADGLSKLSKKMNNFNSEQIRSNSMQYSWKNITDRLDSYIQNIINSRN